MSVQKQFLLLLLFLSVLMGLGIIIPGYLKIRDFEWLEARNYTLDRSVRMLEKIEQRIDVLRKAGVSEIPSYVDESKGDMLREFEAMEKDARVARLVLDSGGEKIFDGSSDLWLDIKSPLLAQLKPSLLAQIKQSKEPSLSYEGAEQAWMVSFQKQHDWNWYILSMMSEQEVYRDSKNYLLYVLGVSALVILVVLTLSILLTQQIRTRAGSILQQLGQYGDGDYEERLRVTGPAELGELQVGINSMIDNIEMEILSRKTIEEALNSARLQAEEINHAKAEYVRDMNHQTQNAMTSVCGFSELLLKTELEDKQRSYVNNILSGSQLLSSLVGDMLALSGIEVADEQDTIVEGETPELLPPLLENVVVLLVGVDPLNCAYLTEILDSHGLMPIVVHDEPAAIKYLEEEDVDLIFLDIDRSKFSRNESIAYLRSNLTAYAGSIPILVMTSKADSQSMAWYRRLGAANGIRKPFSATRLFNIMTDIFQSEEEAQADGDSDQIAITSSHIERRET